MIWTRFSFRGFGFNKENVRVRDVTGLFGLPPLRGQNFVASGRTGQIWTPKKHDGRVVTLELVVTDTAENARIYFDQLAALFANRTQGPLVWTGSDGAPRTAQAECIAWMPADTDTAGAVFVGRADFFLADPWFYGATVSGSVVPNATLAFGTPVISNISGQRTTWAAALTGITSGQPIVVVHATVASTGAATSIADTFAGHYTWTRVDGDNTYHDLEIYIGTGGTGTSGTVTVTAPSALIGGAVIPMVGASIAAGLSAVDVHAHQLGDASLFPHPSPSLVMTPGAVGEGAFYVALADPTFFGASLTAVTGGSTNISVPYNASPAAAMICMVLYPASGAALAYNWTNNPGGVWETAGLVVKGGGAASTLNIINPGTVLAENLTLDFLGPITNPTITNTTNGTSITINTSVAETKHLIVDTGAFTAQNDGSNVIGSVAHSGAEPFLTLAPGVNVLQVSGATCTGSTLVAVSFAAPYG
jgi:hypothetical protein